MNNNNNYHDPNRRLHRSMEDRVLTGVCGGVAEYFALDPTIVRVAWVIFTWFWGAGLIAYIICALVLPEDGYPPVEQPSHNYTYYDPDKYKTTSEDAFAKDTRYGFEKSEEPSETPAEPKDTEAEKESIEEALANGDALEM